MRNDALDGLADWYARSARRRTALEMALTPSADTKAVYHGEFKVTTQQAVYADEEEDSLTMIDVETTIDWPTVKAIMAAIRKNADEIERTL